MSMFDPKSAVFEKAVRDHGTQLKRVPLKPKRIRRSYTGWFSVKNKPTRDGPYEVRGPGLTQMKRGFFNGAWQYNARPGDEWRGLDGPPRKTKE